MNGRLPEGILEVVNRVAAAQGVEVYYAEWRGRTLRVEIERGSETTLDVCTAYSRALSLELDAVGAFSERYFLEVSSPGINRSLHRPDHFRKAVGSPVKVRTASETVEGIIRAADDESVTLSLESDGETVERAFAYHDIRSARLHVPTAELFAARSSARQARTEDGA